MHMHHLASIISHWCCIYASVNRVIICSGNGLMPLRCLHITWTNAALLSIGLLGTNFSEIWIRILSSSFKKMHLKMSSAKMAAILFRGRCVNMRWSMRCLPITYYVSAPTSVINFLIIYRHSIIMYIPKHNHISWLSGEWLGHNEAWNRHCMQGSMGDGNWSAAWTFVMVINSGNSHCCDSVRAIIVLIL